MQNNKEGFYCRWDKDICLLFCRKAGIEVDIQFMDTLLQSLLERNFFDTNLFHKFGILTSHSIQIRFFEVTVRRRKIEVPNADFLLVNVLDYKNVYILPQNVDMDTGSDSKNADIPKQSKVKESIVEESRVNLQQQQQHACEEPEKEPENLNEEREQWKEALLADEDWQATLPAPYSSGNSGHPERPSRIRELIETGQRVTEIALKICNSQAV